jgi:hypothetical protein
MGRAAVSVRAINVPGHRHHRPCRTVVTVLVDLIRTVVAALRDLCPTGLDQRAQRVGNTAVTSICGVLVGQRRAHRAVTHPVHQLPRSRARTHGQRFPGCLTSWKWNPVGSPANTTIAGQFVQRPKFPRRSTAPFFQKTSPYTPIPHNGGCSAKTNRAGPGKWIASRAAQW